MTRFYYDDDGEAIAYSSMWTTYRGNTGAVDATSWYDSTFHSCNAVVSTTTNIWPACNATFSFQGPGEAWVIGDYNPSQRTFYCIISVDGVTMPWYWLSGANLTSPNAVEGLNHTRCSVSDLGNKTYSLTFGQTGADVDGNGVTLDYIVVDNSTSTGSGLELTWSSDFVDTTPDANYAWSTATASAVIPSSTALSSAAQGTGMTTSSSSRTSSSSSSTSSAVEIGVGVGVGVGGALILAFLAGWFLMKRRTRKRTDDGTELQSSNKDGRTPVQEWVSSSFGGDQHPQPAYDPVDYRFHPWLYDGNLPDVTSSTPRPSGEAATRPSPATTTGGLENPQMFRER